MKRVQVAQTPFKVSAGVSLVELLVSAALGLVILSSLSAVFYDSVQITRTGLSEVKTIRGLERALDVLETTVELAGYVPDIASGVAKEQVYPAAAPFAVGQSLVFEPNGTSSNVFYFRTVGDEQSTVDCLGNIVPDGIGVSMRLEFDSTTKILSCTVDTGGVETTGMLLDSVLFLAVGHFGIHTDNTHSKYAFSEASPADLTPKGVVVEIVTESKVSFFEEVVEQSVRFFLGEVIHFQSSGKVTKMSRFIAIRNN